MPLRYNWFNKKIVKYLILITSILIVVICAFKGDLDTHAFSIPGWIIGLILAFLYLAPAFLGYHLGKRKFIEIPNGSIDSTD